MEVLDGPLRIDFWGTGVSPAMVAGVPQRRLAITSPQRAAAPYPFAQVTLTLTDEATPASSAALSAGPFVPRREWSGSPDERRYTHLLVALTNALPDREAEFDTWYWGRHFPDGQRLPGCFAACRFALAEGGTGAFAHLALYQFAVDDPAIIVDAHAARAGTAEMPLTDAISPVFQAWYAHPVSDWSVTPR